MSVKLTVGSAIAMYLSLSASNDVKYFIPTSQLVSITSAAARDEGFDPTSSGTYLDELRAPDGSEPLEGYESVALYQSGHLVRSYAVRVKTGDVIETMLCRILRYPDLMDFRNQTTRDFQSDSVSTGQISSEVGCEKLDAVP